MADTLITVCLCVRVRLCVGVLLEMEKNLPPCLLTSISVRPKNTHSGLLEVAPARLLIAHRLSDPRPHTMILSCHSSTFLWLLLSRDNYIVCGPPPNASEIPKTSKESDTSKVFARIREMYSHIQLIKKIKITPNTHGTQVNLQPTIHRPTPTHSHPNVLCAHKRGQR